MASPQYVMPVDFARPCLIVTNYGDAKNGVRFCGDAKGASKMASPQDVMPSDLA